MPVGVLPVQIEKGPRQPRPAEAGLNVPVLSYVNRIIIIDEEVVPHRPIDHQRNHGQDQARNPLTRDALGRAQGFKVLAVFGGIRLANPKAETRNPKEGRNQKSKAQPPSSRTWQNNMQLVHTQSPPPNHGRMYLTISGGTWNSRNAPVRIVTA